MSGFIKTILKYKFIYRINNIIQELKINTNLNKK